MAGLKASFYKDMKLFRQSAGIVTLVLPFLLAFVMFILPAGTAPASFVRPFRVAVIDEDQTVMSEMIITQARTVPVFACVDEKSGEAEALIEEGYTAVFTIPKDFFYDAYTFEQQPVRVLFNSENKLQSAVFKAVFTSVMGIMKTEQAVSKTVFEYKTDALSPTVRQEMYEAASKRLISAALSRNNIFEVRDTVQDMAGALIRRISAVSILFLLLFQAFSVMKTLPQDHRLGIAARMKALGAGSSSLMISKICFYLFLTVPSLLLFGALSAYSLSFGITSLQCIEYIILCICMAAASFLSALAVSRFSYDASVIRRTGSICILLSLFFSGTLIPFSSLPEPVQVLRHILPFSCLYPSLEAIALNVSLPVFISLITPALLFTAVVLILCLIPKLSPGKLWPAETDRQPAKKRRTRFILRFLSVSFMKFRMITGKAAGCLFLVLTCILCAAAAAGSTGKTSAVRFTVTDSAGSEETGQLVRDLLQSEEMDVIQTDQSTAYMMLAAGESEGMLTINEKCARYLNGETEKQKDLVFYQSASSSFSAEAVREFIAGKIASERLRREAPARVYELYGTELSEAEKELLYETCRENEEKMNDLFVTEYVSGTPEADPFSPPFESFPAMAALFLCMSAASWCGERDNRRTDNRILSLPGGRLLGRGTDFLSVFLCGLIPMICFAVFRPIRFIPALLYLADITALSLVISQKNESEGKIDGVFPYTAFLICLIGGCFADPSSLSPVLSQMTMLSPAGLFLHMSAGNVISFVITVSETLLFIFLHLM